MSATKTTMMVPDETVDRSRFRRFLTFPIHRAWRSALGTDTAARIVRLSAVGMTLAMVGSASFSQAEEAADFASAFGLARKELLQGNYLTAIGLVRPFALTDTADEPPVIRDAGAYQVWDQMQAMVSGEPGRFKPDETDPPDRDTITAFAEAASRDALSAIADRARSTRVVILNENHTTPCQRAFAARVAERLRPLGYDTLALEALATVPSSTAVELRKRGYPVFGDGFYTRDPAFSAFIRRSLQLGFTPLAYEYNPAQGSAPQGATAREKGQAENLAKFLSDHPKSKIFIYSGGGHLAEEPLEDGSKMMGKWLRELSGIDPLTIDQNRLQPGTSTRRYLIKHNIASDRVLFSGDTPLVVGNLAGRVDMQILPAEARYVDGRPGCLMGTGRRSRKIPLPGGLEGREFLLQAIGAHDDAAAVPLDQAIVRSGMSTVTLFLPNTPVRYVWKK